VFNTEVSQLLEQLQENTRKFKKVQASPRNYKKIPESLRKYKQVQETTRNHKLQHQLRSQLVGTTFSITIIN
jgi:hypothetical protein